MRFVFAERDVLLSQRAKTFDEGFNL